MSAPWSEQRDADSGTWVPRDQLQQAESFTPWGWFLVAAMFLPVLLKAFRDERRVRKPQPRQ